MCTSHLSLMRIRRSASNSFTTVQHREPFEFCFGNIFAGEVFEFAADDVGGETGAEEAAVEGSKFFVVDFAVERAQLALDALANQGGFVGHLRDFFESGFDVAVRDAPRTQVPCDTKLALFASLGAMAGKLSGVAGVVDQAGSLESRHNSFHERLVFAAARERL